MTNDEYLKKVTVGNPVKLDGNVTLCEYTSKWAELFEKECAKIAKALNGNFVSIQHVGSTSVPGLCAKPILDILLLVKNSGDESTYVPALEKLGYVLRIREPDWYEHRMLKGSSPEVNLHVFSDGCEESDRMIAFRNWLRTNEEDREQYASVKRTLAKKSWKYMQDYANAKSEVVANIFQHMKNHNKNGSL